MDASILLVEGGQIRLAAAGGQIDLEKRRRDFPIPIDESSVAGRTILSKSVVNVGDVEAPDAPPFAKAYGRKMGYRAIINAPLLREGVAIGTLGVLRSEPGQLDARQVKVLQTFADQAVIAIENARLFNETKEALERQTATAEILKVIASSPSDVQPVFDSIALNTLRLCEGSFSVVSRFDGELIHLAAMSNVLPGVESAMRGLWPIPAGRKLATARAIAEKCVVQIPDTREDPEYDSDGADEVAKFRAVLAVPMLREGKPIGTIGVNRPDPGPFPEHQIALLQTFADQAVIAIENVRLFKELQSRTEALTQSVGQLTALGEVGQAISSTLDLETVLRTIVSRAVQLTALDGGSIYEYDEHTQEFHLRAAENVDEDYLALLRRTRIRKGEGAVGRTGLTGEPTQIPDIRDRSLQSRLRDAFIRAGYRAVLVVPLLRDDHIIGALSVTRKTPGPFPDEVVELLKTFATQSAMAIQNARLFREIAEKGKQLEEASKHKSQFLASMSHELRTPLNAILGFNEMILDGIYGPVSADIKSPLQEMQDSGKHLLRLINNVLDLAKIEAGRMELALSDYSVPDTVGSVRSTLRSLATEKGLELLTVVPADIPLAYGDPGRMSQCLLNLAGNALKFTKAGKVEIAAKLEGDRLVYRVSDTGIGIPADKIGTLFTEFKQTDATIASEYGGTGLGLSITKKFIEMHGGRIWVESELGKGSAFIFEVPLRV